MLKCHICLLSLLTKTAWTARKSMEKLKRLLRLFQNIRQETEAKAIAHLSSALTKARISDMNTERLLNEGMRADGVPLGEYAASTIRMKQARGQEYRWVTLRDQGDFHRGISVDTAKGAIEVTSSDAKTDMLLDRYGDAVLGLTPADIQELRQDVKLMLIEETKKDIADALRP